MNTNMNTKPVKQLSEKAREGKRRRQQERRRRQREERKNEDKWDYDDYDDDDDDIYDYLCERSNFIICDDKFRGCENDFNELSTKMAQIFAEQNSSVPNNLKTYKYVLLDEFISKTQPTEGICQFKISGKDLYDGKKLYNQMKDDPDPNYEIFGSNGNGCTCFSLFKSADKNMYIIVIDGYNDNTLTHYVKI